MKLAVVIPCYNHEAYIGAAIESVLGQSRPPERFVIIDDGSKDNSVEVIRRYEKDGVECIAQENAGAHTTINRAIEMAASDCDVISILNSDDIYELERFATLLPALTEDKSVVCSGVNLIDDDGVPLSEESPRAKWYRAVWSLGQDPNRDLCEWLGTANFLATTSNIVARSKFLTANPFRAYRFNHDYFFLVTAALQDQLALVPDKLLRYRVHATNTINTDPAPLMREMLLMQLHLYREFAPELPNDEGLRRRFYAYTRAVWNNVSSFHAGIFELLLAQLTAGASEKEIAQAVAELDLDELNRYPNSALVNQYNPDAEGGLLAGQGLAEKFGELKRTNSEIKSDVSALKELNKLRSQLMACRWIALGCSMGLCKGLRSNAGKTPQAKLENLRAQLAGDGWVKLGRDMGLVPKDLV